MPLIPIASCTYWVVLECSCNSTRRGWGACAEVLKSLIRFQLLGRGTAHLVSLTPSSASLSSPSSFWIYRTRTYLNTNLIVALDTMKKIMMTMNGGDWWGTSASSKPLNKLTTRMATIYLNSDMMVGSGQPRSSTSSTVEFWSENEKQRFTWDFD